MARNRKRSLRWLLAFIRNRFLTGLFLIIPLTVTVLILTWFYEKATEWGLTLSNSTWLKTLLGSYIKDSWFSSYVRLLAFLAILIGLFLIGELASYTIIRRMLILGENIMLKVPMVKTIYLTSRQIIDAVRAPGGGMFRKVVLFEYPRKGIYVIGFMTNENKSDWEIGKQSGRDLVSIFLPTTPNPTSGFLLFVPREDCIFLEMSVTEGMRLVISGGAVAPGQTQTQNHIQIPDTKEG